MIQNYKILSIIPCRAGSVGLPGKNFKDFYGRPLFFWSLDASIKSKYVDLTAVSTNDQNVQGRMYGYMHSNIKSNLKCMWRPEELCSGTSKSEETLIHVSKELKNQYDIIIMLQATSPIRTNNLLDKCIEEFIEEKSDSLLTVGKDNPFIWKIINGKPVASYDYKNRPMRQEISEWIYKDDGNIYIVKKDILLKEKCRIGGKISLFESDSFQTLQIDTNKDFQIMENVSKIIGGPLSIKEE